MAGLTRRRFVRDAAAAGDLLVGVRMADRNDRPDSGSAYLFFSGR